MDLIRLFVRELNTSIQAIHNALQWKDLTITPSTMGYSQEHDLYRVTYDIDLSSFSEIEIGLFINGWGCFGHKRITVNQYGDQKFNHIYGQAKQGYVWIGGLYLGSDNKSVTVDTYKNSTSYTQNYLFATYIKAR